MPHFPLHDRARARCIDLYGVDPEESFEEWMRRLTGRSGAELRAWLERGASELLPQATVEPERPTPSQLRVLRLVACGMSNREIADALGCSSETVKSHVQHAIARLGATDRTHAVVIALARGWLHRA